MKKPNDLMRVLIGEIIDLSQSENLLIDARIPVETLNENTVGTRFQIVGFDRLADEIAIGQGETDSSINQYLEVVRPFETMWNTFCSYSIDSEEVVLLDQLMEKVYPSQKHTTRIQEVGDRYFTSRPIEGFKAADFKAHLVVMIDNHFAQMCYARALTLRRSFVVTEMMFRAYAHGLIPFGWIDYPSSTLLCVSAAEVL